MAKMILLPYQHSQFLDKLLGWQKDPEALAHDLWSGGRTAVENPILSVVNPNAILGVEINQDCDEIYRRPYSVEVTVVNSFACSPTEDGEVANGAKLTSVNAHKIVLYKGAFPRALRLVNAIRHHDVEIVNQYTFGHILGNLYVSIVNTVLSKIANLNRQFCTLLFKHVVWQYKTDFYADSLKVPSEYLQKAKDALKDDYTEEHLTEVLQIMEDLFDEFIQFFKATE